MKKMLIASFDMEVGGVERSLVSMLENLDYANYAVDLMLYRHQGDFMDLISDRVNLLPEVSSYTTFRKSTGETLKEGHYGIGLSRVFSKLNASLIGKAKKMAEPGCYQMQLMWKYALPFLPKLDTEYDVAVSYLWPHYFVADKVQARTKIAWIHTDFSTIETDIDMDLKMWNKFNHIVAVSDACKDSFLKKYPSLENKLTVIENITSPAFVRKMAEEDVENPMVEDDRFKVVTVARLSHAKGIDHAVRALKVLREKGYGDIAWYVVGYGGDEELVKGLIREYQLQDCFHLLGKQTNPYPYMKAADLYVQPSRYEGKAVTVTEAKILAKPLVITNYTTSSSQVQNGFDGYVTELSVKGIADGIEKLYKQPELRKKLENNCANTDHSNTSELKKLYKLIAKGE